MDNALVKESERILGYDKETLLKMYDLFITHRFNFDCDISESDRWDVMEKEWKKLHN